MTTATVKCNATYEYIDQGKRLISRKFRVSDQLVDSALSLYIYYIIYNITQSPWLLHHYCYAQTSKIMVGGYSIIE